MHYLNNASYQKLSYEACHYCSLVYVVSVLILKSCLGAKWNALHEIQSDWRHAIVTQQSRGGVCVWVMNVWCSVLFYNCVVLFNR